jgi:hypothetical protein
LKAIIHQLPRANMFTLAIGEPRHLRQAMALVSGLPFFSKGNFYDICTEQYFHSPATRKHGWRVW